MNDKPKTHCSPRAAAPLAWIEGVIVTALGLLGLYLLFQATVTDHLSKHIEALRDKLAVTTDPQARERIRQQIAAYERNRERGTLPAGCKQYVKAGVK